MRVRNVWSLIEGRKLNALRCFQRSLRVCSRHIIAIALSYCCFVNSSHALGLGQAKVHSHIGEPLHVSIPMLDLDPSESASPLVLASDPPSADSDLSATITSVGGTSIIRVVSQNPIREPYLGFRLQLTNNQSSYAKDYQVLLDPPPNRSESSSQVTIVSTPVPSNTASIMGPYDWAQAGSIPKQFGPVLDGQALWRVARRINKAMSVSVEQMMLALYQANPGAFSSDSIGSLQAGSVLSIPSERMVKRVSHSEAKAALDAGFVKQSSDSNAAEPATEIQKSTPSTLVAGQEKATLEETNASANHNDSVPSFQLSGIDGAALQTADTNLLQRTEQQDEIIQSLSETVGNLTQELIKKDAQINSLQEQVDDLKALVKLDESLNESRLFAADSFAGNSVPEQTYNLPKWFSPLAILLLSAGVAWFLKKSMFRVIAGMRKQENLDELMAKQEPDYQWNSSIRDTVERIMDEYNRDNDSKKLETSSDGGRKLEPELSEEASSFLLEQESDSELQIDGDGLGLDGNTNTVRTIEIDDEDLSFESEEAQDVPNFDQRFTELIQEGNYEFAKEFLDYSRGTTIDDVKYHCQRLRLLKHQDDEKAFYDYYYLIESKMSSFPFEAQTEISQMVVELSQKQRSH